MKIMKDMKTSRSGQAIIFLVMVLVILVFIVLWNFDLHKILYAKYSSQNGGDAAAMAASRWQAISLNLVGDLNILQAVALSDFLSGVGNEDTMASLSELQARLCYVGPMIGMMSSQQAAKNNGIHVNDAFTAYLEAHVSTIYDAYPEFIIEPYTNCFEEYAMMLQVICDNGVAAGPDNMTLYNDYLGDHTLLDLGFYDAIATRAWCWFWYNEYDLLRSYNSYRDWDPLPVIQDPSPINCEFYSLRLSKWQIPLWMETIEVMNDLHDSRNLPGGTINPHITDNHFATFYLYANHWYQPFPMSDPNFPAEGEVVEMYNYAGADAAVRISSDNIELRTPGSSIDAVTWTAAAKPFGHLNEGDKPTTQGIVLPAFHDVRLIPVDASSAPSGGSFNLPWRRHCEDHLPEYIDRGEDGLSGGCGYCQQLRTWESAEFRDPGIVWLRDNSILCNDWVGTRPGGGSRVGH